jgi:hypothetical protein
MFCFFSSQFSFPFTLHAQSCPLLKRCHNAWGHPGLYTVRSIRSNLEDLLCTETSVTVFFSEQFQFQTTLHGENKLPEVFNGNF